ncbi:unnamed protein product [Closterium sp. Yama58-4]|nr:unnamed protein product [Closterium sp. Yama58-4]
MPGYNVGMGSGTGGGFRYANVGMGWVSGDVDVGLGLGINHSGQSLSVVVGNADARVGREPRVAPEIIEYPVAEEGRGDAGHSGNGVPTGVSPESTRPGGPFNPAGNGRNSRQPYSANAIDTGVNDEPPRRRLRDWRSSAFDEDGGDELHAGLTQVLSLPWPDTEASGDAQHAGTDEPGFEGEDDPEPDGADNWDDEEGGISVQTGFHRNRMGSRYRIGGIQLLHWARLFAPTRRYGIYTSNAAETKKIRMLPPNVVAGVIVGLVQGQVG